MPPVGHTAPVFFAIPRLRWHGRNLPLGWYEAVYDNAIRHVDQELRGLFEALRRIGRYEDTTIAVVGTFGLQFGESGLYIDHGMFTPADLHVPWILRPAGGRGFETGVRCDALASLIDLAPTLIELEGLARPEGMHGLSQLDVLQLRRAEPVRPHAFASSGLQYGYAAYTDSHVYEYVEPGRGGVTPLSTSWFGDGEPHADVLESYYRRDLRPAPLPGTTGPPPKGRRRGAAAGGALVHPCRARAARAPVREGGAARQRRAARAPRRPRLRLVPRRVGKVGPCGSWPSRCATRPTSPAGTSS